MSRQSVRVRAGRLGLLTVGAMVAATLAVASPAAAAPSPTADSGIMDTGGFAAFDVTANDGVDGTQYVDIPTNSDPDVSADGTEIDVDLGSDTTPFTGTKTIPYTLHQDDGTAIGTATLTVKVVDPSAVQVVAGNGQVTVSWPGLPTGVTSVRISYAAGFVGDHATGTTVTTPAGTPKVISGLSNGTDYGFFVTAVYAGQDDPDGASLSTTPRAVNHAPDAVDDTFSLVSSSVKTLDPTLNDNDQDGDTLTVTAHSSPAHGTVTCDGSECDYTPSGAPVDDSFTYTVSDGYGGTDTATVHLVVRHVTAVSDTAATYVDEEVDVDILANDTGVLAGDSVQITVPNGVDAFFDGFDSRLLQVTGETVGNFTIAYSIQDEDGDTLASTSVAVSVGPKRPLVAVDDAADTDLGVATDIDVTDDDTIAVPGGFPLSNAGTKITVAPQHGTATLSFEPGPYTDEVTHNSSIQNLPVIHYTPAAHYLGADTLTYQLQDAAGNVDTATVHISVDVPGAGALFAVPGIASADVSWNLSPSPNIDQELLCYTQGTNRVDQPDPATRPCDHSFPLPTGTPTSTTLTGLVNDVYYTLTLFVHSDDGTAAGVWSSGTSWSFRPGVRSVEDLTGDGGPSNLTVTWANPVAPQASTGTTIRYSTTAAPTTPTDGAGGTTVGAGATTASLTGLAPGTYYVSVFATNTGTYGDPVSTTLVLAAGNHAPVATADNVETDENSSVQISPLSNDTDADNDQLDLKSYSDPTHGFVDCEPQTDAQNHTTQVCHYQPDQAFFGVDTFTYVVTDHRFGQSTGTVTVTVHQVNQAPFAGNDSVTATVQHATPIDLTQDASDPNNDTLTYSVVTPPAHGTLTCGGTGACTYTGTSVGPDSFVWKVTDNGTNPSNLSSSNATESITVVANQPPVVQQATASVAAGASVTFSIAAGASDPDGDTLTYVAGSPPQKGSVTCTTAGSCTYTASASAAGQDSFLFTASDGHGGTANGSAIITITQANHAPVAADSSFVTDNATPVVVNVAGLSSDADNDTLTFGKVSGPSPTGAGTVGCSGTSCTYTPSATFTGVASFVYSASDGHGGSDNGTVSITVTQANRAPHATTDAATVQPGQSVTINVAANDTDADGDALTFALNNAPVHGTATCTTAGSCTYQSTAGFTGTDSFDYTVTDGHGGMATGTVTITVGAPPPVTGTATIVRGGAASRSVLSPLKVTGVLKPARGGVTIYLQRLSAGKWANVGSAKTAASGAYTVSVKQTTGAFSYRAFVPAATGYAAVTSASVTASFYQLSLTSSSTTGDEKVVVKNVGKVAVNLKGWAITTAHGKKLVLPSFSLAAGKSVTVHTKAGKTTKTDIYLAKPNSFAAHDTLSLKDLVGVVVASRKF